MAGDAPPVVVPLPRRLDRRMRLGPFPSARDAMKFAAYAAAGTFALPLGGAVAWLPFLGGAFFLSVYRPDGKGLDDRAGDYVRWRLRHRRAHADPGRGRTTGRRSDGFVRLPGPYLVALVEAKGIPTRFLPPADARELFDRYRALLRAVGTGIHVEVGVTPIAPGAFRLPAAGSGGADERAARDGYAEMVRLVLRRRQRRRVLLAVFVPLQGSACVQRLDAEAAALVGHLAAMGLDPERLCGPALWAALEQLGWPPEAAS